MSASATPTPFALFPIPRANEQGEGGRGNSPPLTALMTTETSLKKRLYWQGLPEEEKERRRARRREILRALSPKRKAALKRYMREWYEKNKEEYLAKRTRYRKAHREEICEKRRKAYAENQKKAFEILGGRCSNPECGDVRQDVLTIDHIKRVPRGKEKCSDIYSNIIKAGHGMGKYRLLCFNCNCALGIRGGFPPPLSPQGDL